MFRVLMKWPRLLSGLTVELPVTLMNYIREAVCLTLFGIGWTFHVFRKVWRESEHSPPPCPNLHSFLKTLK